MTTVNLSVWVSNGHAPNAVHQQQFELSGPDVVYTKPIIDSVIVDPPTGPVGTLFTITINAHDTNEPPFPISFSLYALLSDGSWFGTIIREPSDPPNVFKWQT